MPDLTSNASEKLKVSDIILEDRIRVEAGAIDELVNSIKEYGIIQPLILGKDLNDPVGPRPRVIAGGRRLLALKRLGVKELVHGRDFIWREEVFDESNTKAKLRLQGLELEENLKRKELTWQEIVVGKQKLLALMQSIHGVAESGGRTRDEKAKGSEGFGVRKLASMLGESPATISLDLQIATAMESLPHLAQAQSKESARRQLNIVKTIVDMDASGKAATAAKASPSEKNWTLYKGDFVHFVNKIPDESADLVYIDLPYGVNLNLMGHHASTAGYADDRISILSKLPNVAKEAFRILKQDRFAVFFFGFNYYPSLMMELQLAGFSVNPVPVVWLKHTSNAENPNTRYANAYEQALVCSKRTPAFIRPGQSNIVDVAPVQGTAKLHIAQQPIPLVEKFILDMTFAGALVVDFMAGSGTTGVAALKNNRRVVLFEQDKSYWPIIEGRLATLK